MKYRHRYNVTYEMWHVQGMVRLFIWEMWYVQETVRLFTYETWHVQKMVRLFMWETCSRYVKIIYMGNMFRIC